MENFINAASFSRSLSNPAPHYHNSHQILYITGGTAETTIDDKKYLLKRHSLVLINRMETHSVKVSGDGYERYELKISSRILNSNSENNFLYSAILNRPKGFGHVIENYVGGENIFKRIISEYCSESPYRDEMLALLLDMLFIDIYRVSPSLFPEERTPAFDVVRQIQKQIETNIKHRYTLSEFSEKYHLSSFYLSHLFKSVTGYSIMGYLKATRIAHARRLLTYSDKNINEIIEDCGFTDASNFSREFKETVGVTPSDFRKKHKN